MDAATLKRYVDETGSPFFDGDTMRAFGDRMSNYGVQLAWANNDSGEVVQVWELYRKRPVKFNLTSSAFFGINTFKKVNNVSYIGPVLH